MTGVLGHLCVLWLGAISYPLYSLHRNNGYWLMSSLHGLRTPPAVATIVAIAGGLALASAFTYGIERPAMNVLRRWYRGRKAPASP